MFRGLETVRTLIIHCADTPNGKDYSAVDIDEWHKARGFQRAPQAVEFWQPGLRHIGYHGIIDAHGTIVYGRSPFERGAHVEGHNADSLGWCLVGRDRFSARQWDSLRTLVDMLRSVHRGLSIVGHHDLNTGKTCPGFDVNSWLARGMIPDPKHVL